MPSSLAGASLAFLLVSSVLIAQQTAGKTPQTREHRTGMSRPSSRKAEGAAPTSSVEIINGSSRQTLVFNEPQRTIAFPGRTTSAPTETRVEVINGSARRTVVLNTQQSMGTNPQKGAPRRGAKYRAQKGLKTAPPRYSAEIINGTRKEMAVFNGGAEGTSGPGTGRKNLPPIVVGIVSSDSNRERGDMRPVAIRIASSGSESEDGNTKPVVIGIASSGSESERWATPPVAIGISPRPSKRPPYRRSLPSPE